MSMSVCMCVCWFMLRLHTLFDNRHGHRVDRENVASLLKILRRLIAFVC